MPPLPRCLAHGRVREFGCGITSCHVRRCCRNRGGLLRKQNLDENAMHVAVVIIGNRQKTESDERTRNLMVRLVSAFGWLPVVLPSLSAKQLVKLASTFLSAFRLLPRLEEVHIPWICCRQPQSFAINWFANSHSLLSAFPLNLNLVNLVNLGIFFHAISQSGWTSRKKGPLGIWLHSTIRRHPRFCCHTNPRGPWSRDQKPRPGLSSRACSGALHPHFS